MSDLIERQAVEAITWEEPSYTDALNALTEVREKIRALPSVSTEKTDAYKQGWHDAVATALKETHNIYTDDGVFRVVQEETLIGVGMAYEQVSTVESLNKAKSEIRCGENKAYNADFTMGCEYAIGVIERAFEEVEE